MYSLMFLITRIRYSEQAVKSNKSCLIFKCQRLNLNLDQIDNSLTFFQEIFKNKDRVRQNKD